MDCVNHSGVTATAFCQNCGKALCANCVRTAAGGQILCEPCWMAWQSAQTPFAGTFVPHGVPNPAAAAALGVIPGVGAMYNGQFVKGLIHIFIFAILVSTASHFDIFGLFVAGWIVYQVFEAYHVAKARRDGMPVPDPLGLNEIGNWLNIGPRGPNQPGPNQSGPNQSGPNQPGANPMNPGFGPGVPPQPPYGAGPAGTGQGTGWQSPYQGNPYQGAPYVDPGQAQGPGFTSAGVPPIPPIPPMPPVPPLYWKRKEPIGAVVLIALGLLFLMGRLDLFSGRAFSFGWPLILIGLGVWMVVRRMQDSQGGPR
jgi:TM2 domain-containing membrane protein YozV